MQDVLEKIIKNFVDFFMELDVAKRVGLIAVSGITVAVMVGIILWATATRFEVLYTNLNKEDAKRISVILEEKKIPYQTTKDGKSIMIPSEDVNRFRLELATMGVNFTGTVGYEVFDKQAFGTTSFVQRVNKQRALEGELVKTIKHFNGVKRARVHLSIPESSPFVSEKKAPNASVVIELNEGVVLTPEEIKGIGHLVASSVEGMRPENVVVLDQRGKKLSENIGDPLTQYTANQMALESKKNRQLEDQIEDILSKVVGEGKVIAKVSVKMDFTESVATTTTYDPENAAVLSEVKNTQKLQGRRPSPQGIPGARSNLPGEKPQPGIPETSNDVQKELSTQNKLVPSVVTKSRTPTAGIKRISAAVMIDGKRVPALAANGAPIVDQNGKQVMKYEQWSDADLQNFSQIVASAIGISDRRGDTIVIKNMEFAQEDMDSVEAMIRERETREFYKNLVKYGAVGLTICLFFFVVARPFIQWVTDNTVESVEDFLPKTLEELEKVQANQKLPGLEEALPQIEEKLNPEKIEGNMLREKIISLVENNPAKAAQVLHDMIHSTDSDKQIA